MGTVVLSIDAELGWGFRDYSAAERPAERIARSRWGWNRAVETLAEFDIPATWAVVGHLFESECTGAHVGHPTPPGWFAHERGENPMDPQYRYAPELLADLATSDVGHDIGAYTYSDVDFSADYATEALARAECDRTTEAAEAAGVQMRSFVFPHNRVGHREILAESGFTCYRGPGPEPERRLDGSYSAPLRKLARATVLPDPEPLVEPSLDEYGLVNIPPSLYLFGFKGTTRQVLAATVGDPVVRQARLGIDAAARREGIYHLWLRLNDLTTEADLDRFRAVCAYLDSVRAEEGLTVETMRSVADRVVSEDFTVA